MSPRIDFYVLPGTDSHQRQLTACRLTEKAYRQGLEVYIQTTGPDETKRLDQLLWTFRQGSFVPHETGQTDPETPVVIGEGPPPERIRDVLINLAADVPSGFERFARVAELVDQDEPVRQAGRQRYRAYQNLGYAVQTVKLDGTE